MAGKSKRAYRWPKKPMEPWPLTSFADVAVYYQKLAAVHASINGVSREMLEMCAGIFVKEGDEDAAKVIREHLEETRPPEMAAQVDAAAGLPIRRGKP